MATNVEVVKNASENNLSILRRFTKRVQGSGVLPRLRGRRYAKRTASPYTQKKMALKKLARRAEVSEAIKMGKMTANTRG